MGNNMRKIIFTFLDSASAVTNGAELHIGTGMVNMNLAVTGTATAFNIVVEAKDNKTDEFTPVSVVNLNTLDISPNITVTGKYQLSLEGHMKIRCRLSEISSGSITVKGTVTD